MYRHFAYILVLLAALLAGCTAQSADPVTVPAETGTQATPSPEAQATIETEATVPEETAATEAPVPEQTPAATNAATETPYLLKIERPDQSIYQGPSYDYGYVGTVRKSGTYTIVEEAEDSEGNLWGRLKSGAGWVDLTELRSEKYRTALISANYADDELIGSGAYHHYSDAQEYRIPIAFRAYGKLRDVRLFGFEFQPDGYFPGADFYTLPELTSELPLVAELAFPGDMTMYGICFTDEAGIVHTCSIHISGRNGALVLNEE